MAGVGADGPEQVVEGAGEELVAALLRPDAGEVVVVSVAAQPTMRSTAGDRPPLPKPSSRSRGAKPRPQPSQWYHARESSISPSAVTKVFARRPA